MTIAFNLRRTFYNKIMFLKIKLSIYLDNLLLSQLINKRLNVYFVDKLFDIKFYLLKFNFFQINNDFLSKNLENSDLNQFINFQATKHFGKLAKYLNNNPETTKMDIIFSKKIFLNNIKIF